MAVGLLEGLRVVDASRHFPGPFATLALADLGAEVIKLEPPGLGDPLRVAPPYHEGEALLFGAFNRGKRSLCVDLKRPEARELVARLSDTADVFIESFRPGVAARLGIDAATLRARKPALVYCSLTGYGQTGPLRDLAGHDLNFCALSGLLDRSGPADGPPAMLGQPLADLAAGGLYAATTILAALIARPRRGGSTLDVAMLDGLLALQAGGLCEVVAGDPARRGETMLTGALPCYRIYETADGGHVAMAALEEKFWAAFVEATGRPELAELAYDEDPAAMDAVGAVFASQPRDHWAALGARVDCCLTPVLTTEEAARHPQVQARRLLVDDGPTGIRFPARVDPEGVVGHGPAPELGADGDALLAELGYDETARQALVDAGAVQPPSED